MHEHDDCWQEYCARAGDTERIAEIPNLIDLSFVSLFSVDREVGAWLQTGPPPHKDQEGQVP